MLRSFNAASIPIVDVSPVMISIHDAPTLVGFPSDSPVTLIIPVMP